MNAASGWRMEARYVPAAVLYDGSGARGELLGSTAIPSLDRGARATITLEVPAPSRGDWLVGIRPSMVRAIA